MKSNAIKYAFLLCLLVSPTVFSGQTSVWVASGVSNYKGISISVPYQSYAKDEYFTYRVAYEIGGSKPIKKLQFDKFGVRYGLTLSQRGAIIRAYGKTELYSTLDEYEVLRGFVKDYVLSYPITFYHKKTGLYVGFNRNIKFYQKTAFTSYVEATTVVGTGKGTTGQVGYVDEIFNHYSYHVTGETNEFFYPTLNDVFSRSRYSIDNVIQTGFHVGFEYFFKKHFFAQIEYNHSFMNPLPYNKEKAWLFYLKIGVNLTKNQSEEKNEN